MPQEHCMVQCSVIVVGGGFRVGEPWLYVLAGGRLEKRVRKRESDF